jgi:hypothetical protein
MAPPPCSSITPARCSPLPTTRMPRSTRSPWNTRPCVTRIHKRSRRTCRRASTSAASSSIYNDGGRNFSRASPMCSRIRSTGRGACPASCRRKSPRSGRTRTCGVPTSRRIRNSRSIEAGRASCLRCAARWIGSERCARALPRPPAWMRLVRSPAASTIRTRRICASCSIARARRSRSCRAAPGPS